MLDTVVIAQAVVGSGFDKFINTFASGIALGAIYAILALGFVIIFKATQVVNFAHGAIAAFGAYLVVYFATVINIPGKWVDFLPVTLQWILSAGIAIVVAALVGVIIERVTIRPMIGEPLFAVAMITLGLDLIIRTITTDYLGNQLRGIGDPWGTNTIDLGVLRMSQSQLVMIVVTAFAMATLAWFFRTKTGVAMRATAFDQEAAMAQGINVGKVFAIAWAIGASLAAVGGIFSSMSPRAAGVTPFTAFIAFRSFPAVVIGGLDSIPGAIVGGMLVGSAEVFAGSYLIGDTWSALGVGFSGIVPWLLMMLVLVIKPYGIFGTEEVRRV